MHDNFLSVFQDTWTQPLYQLDPVRRLMAKFKRARKALSKWHKQLSKLANTIENNKLIIQFMDLIEETRDLTIQECNLRDILTHQLQNMLEQQKVYWKQRCKIKWSQSGDASTIFFHTTASMRQNHNFIATIQDDT
jgi:regulator of replication initiation timing